MESQDGVNSDSVSVGYHCITSNTNLQFGAADTCNLSFCSSGMNLAIA